MKAILDYSQTTVPNTKFTYGDKISYWVSPTETELRFRCYTDDGKSMDLNMSGTGVPRLEATNNCEYEIEIKIKSVPKIKSVDYIIK